MQCKKQSSNIISSSRLQNIMCAPHTIHGISPSAACTVCITEDLSGCESRLCMQGVCTMHGMSPDALCVLQRTLVDVRLNHACRGCVHHCGLANITAAVLQVSVGPTQES